MQRRRFTGEFKAEAVRQALLPGVSKAQVAQDMGIHSNMLRKWIRLAQGDSHPKLVKATESAVELARENQRLQKELARVKMERDILKKATVGSTDRRNRGCQFIRWSMKSQRFPRALVEAPRDLV